MIFPKPYLILIQCPATEEWTIRAEYEMLSTAELHASDILRNECPMSVMDVKIVKDLLISLKAEEI